MGEDEIKREIINLGATGRISHPAMREAMENPIEGEKIVRLDRVEQETNRQGRVQDRMAVAIFGDKNLGITGLVKDVGELKVIIARAVWTVGGIVSLGGLILTLLGLWIEYNKH